MPGLAPAQLSQIINLDTMIFKFFLKKACDYCAALNNSSDLMIFLYIYLYIYNLFFFKKKRVKICADKKKAVLLRREFENITFHIPNYNTYLFVNLSTKIVQIINTNKFNFKL